MPWEKLLQRATCTCSFRWASFWDTSKILEIDTWLTGFITDFKQSNKLICCAKQSPQETFSRDATALWFLSWDEICVIISIIMNEQSAHAQRKPPAARHRTFSPGKKKNKTMWITSDANYFVDVKSHAREKPLVTGHQSIPYNLTKDIFGIIKWKSPLDRHSKGTKGFIGKAHHFPLLFKCRIPVEMTG